MFPTHTRPVAAGVMEALLPGWLIPIGKKGTTPGGSVVADAPRVLFPPIGPKGGEPDAPIRLAPPNELVPPSILLTEACAFPSGTAKMGKPFMFPTQIKPLAKGAKELALSPLPLEANAWDEVFGVI